MAEVLFGAETEYAVAVRGRARCPGGGLAMELLQQARERLTHLPDLSPGDGMFLSNGARFYVDCGSHPEYCTPECANPWDLVRQVEAGHRILPELAETAKAAVARRRRILCFRSNVDYSGAFSTWGAHESYLYMGASKALPAQLIPHLVTRPIYTGSGGFVPHTGRLVFTLSPRLVYFDQEFSDNSTRGRGIWHEKHEPLCAKHKRLHVICGESLCSQTALLLKFGVTALIVAMADAGLKPGTGVKLTEPVRALRTVIGDPTCKTPLAADRRSLTAIQVQRHYLEFAEAHLGEQFMPAWAGEICHLWRSILDKLDAGPEAVARTLDWAIKLRLYADQAPKLGIGWEDCVAAGNALASGELMNLEEQVLEPGDAAAQASLADDCDPGSLQTRILRRSNSSANTITNKRARMFEIDTRFGQLGAGGIFNMLDRAGVLEHRVVGAGEIERAMTEPPEGGRAWIRGQVVRRLTGVPEARCDWQQIIDFKEQKALDLSDPFVLTETWRPVEILEMHSRRGRADAWQQHPLSRRERAYECFQIGAFAAAEELLRGCVAEGFEVASNRCHLARVLVMMDRELEAREEIAKAWDARDEAHSYVRPRILFFRCLFAILDGESPAEPITQIKDALRAGYAHSSWTIHPMLNHLRGRIEPADFRFLECLAEALSDSSGMRGLDDLPRWRDAAPAPEEAA